MVQGATNRRAFLTSIGSVAAVGTLESVGARPAAGTAQTENWTGYRGGPTHDGTATVDGIDAVERTRWAAGGEDQRATMPAVVDGTAYLGVGARVLAVDVQSGSVAWSASVPAPVPLTPCVGGTTLIATTNGGDVLAIDAESGERAWSIGVGGAAGVPAIRDGTAYVGTSNGRLLALDADSGSVRWSVRRDDVDVPEDSATRPVAIARPAPAVDDDAIYVNVTGSNGGKVVSLARQTGEERWRVGFEEDYVYPPALDGDRLAAASGYGELKVLSTQGGLVRWEKDFENGISSPPAFDGETVSIAHESTYSENRCYAIDADSGENRWEYRFEDATVTGGVSIANGTVYASTYTGSRTGTTVALDYDSGLEQFAYDTGVPTHRTPTPIADGVVIPDGAQVRCLGSDTGDTEPTNDTASRTATDSNDETTETGTSTESPDADRTDRQRDQNASTETTSSRPFLDDGGSRAGSRTLTLASIGVTIIGTLVGLVQLLRGD